MEDEWTRLIQRGGGDEGRVRCEGETMRKVTKDKWVEGGMDGKKEKGCKTKV